MKPAVVSNDEIRSSNTQLHQDMGRAQARLDAMERDIVEIKEIVHELRSFAAEIRGGRKVIGFIWAALGAAAGGFITYLAEAFRRGHGA